MAENAFSRGFGLAAILTLAASSRAQPPPNPFEDVTEQAGISHINMYGGVDTKRYILETTGTGALFFDYDEDGDQDIFLVNGTRLDYEDTQSLSNALYRNDPSDHGGRFSNVTASAGLERTGWGQGAAASDIDNDGDLDLLVTYFGSNLLYQNNGDGTFTETGAEAGLSDPGWGASAAFADFDGDGFVDLFVANYVDFKRDQTPGPGEAPNCFFMGLPVMCGPKGLTPAKSLLYRNRGDGSFEDVSGGGSGVGGERFFGLGAVWGDIDNDGDLDLYVANDQTPNNLYQNDGEGRFTDIALSAGVAYNEDGRAQAGMGVDLGDYNNDGLLDLHVTNFSHDYNTLYQNTGQGFFLDISYQAGIGEGSYLALGWGTGLQDFDRDGWLDIFVTNGHVYPEVRGEQTESDYAQPNLLFLNQNGTFRALDASSDLSDRHVGRGAAFADYDNDGDVDILTSNMNEQPSLFRNGLAQERHWLGLRLIGRHSPRDALGARVTLVSETSQQIREVRSGASYLSQSDLRLLFGLKDLAHLEHLEIRWPSGCRQSLTDPNIDVYTTMVEPTESLCKPSP